MTYIYYFIDLRWAYDSVNHILLFKKLEDNGISEDLINIIKKIYSNAHIRIDPLIKDINVNRGVLQGAILSPILFNLFINDLIKLLEKKTHSTFAYTDDIAVICDGIGQLDDAIESILLWSNENEIELNKNKSGILIIKNEIENFIKKNSDVDDSKDNKVTKNDIIVDEFKINEKKILIVIVIKRIIVLIVVMLKE